MSNFKIYPTSLLSALSDNISLFSDALSITGPTGANGSTGPTGPAGGGGGGGSTTLTLTAGENLVAGDVVKFNLDGEAVKFPGLIEETITSMSTANYISSCYDTTNQRIVIYYKGTSNFGYAIVGEVNPATNTITFGTPVVFESATTSYISCCYDSTSDRIVIVYRDEGNSGFGTAIVGAVNPATNAITFGTAVVFDSTNTQYTFCVYDPVEDRVLIAYTDNGNSSFGTAIVGNVDAGTESITFGTPVVFNSANTQSPLFSIYDPIEDRVVITYRDGGNSGFGTAIVGNVDAGTESITFGTAVVFESASTSNFSCCYDSTSDRVVIAYSDVGNSQFGTAIVGNVDAGTESITFGTPVVFESANTQYTSCCFDSITNRVAISYFASKFGSTTVFDKAVVVGQVSGETIIFSSPVLFSTNTSSNYYTTCVFDSSTQRVVAASFNATVIPLEYYTGVAPLGIAQAAITSGNTGSILVSGVDTNQSGLSRGSYYRMNHFTAAIEPTNDITSSKIGFATTSTNILVDK